MAANKTFTPSRLTGNVAGALNAISASVLVDGRRAFTIDTTDSNKFYAHVFDAASTAADNPPGAIRPYDYTSAGVWLNSSSPFGNEIVSKPLLHVRQQEALGVAGGTASVGNNIRVLDAVVTNQITGASLSSNEVTLPAGSFYAEAYAPCVPSTTGSATVILETSASAALIDGSSATPGPSNGAGIMQLKGFFDLVAPTNVRINSVADAAISLGAAASLGNYEVYSELLIWQLDANKEW